MAEYIEREAVEKFIAKGLNNPDKSKAYGYDAVEILAEVHYMDAADAVEVRHGEWIGYNNTGLYDDWKCCHCGRYEDVRNKKNLGDYCKWCGTKMDGGKNE